MRNIVKYAYIFICLLILGSCHRKPLYDDCICYESAVLPISADWEQSGVIPKNVTVLIYDSETEELVQEHIYEDNSNEIQSYVYLTEGNYTAVIFNELRDQIDYLRVSGYNNLSTLNFYVNGDSKAKARLSSEAEYIEQPGDLAVQVIEDIVIDADVITYTYDKYSEGTSSKASDAVTYQSTKLLGLIPTRKTCTMSLQVNATNISMARMPAVVDLHNVSGSYYVKEDRNDTTPYIIQFDMNNRAYNEGSSLDGYIKADVITFGTLGDRMSTSGYDYTTALMLDIIFTLVDENDTEEERIADITELLEFKDTGYTGIYIDATADIEGLPTVIPGGDEDGLSADVAEWDNAEESTINFNDRVL